MECTQAEQQKKNCPTDQDVHSSVLCGPNNPECAAGSKEIASVAQHSLSSYTNFSVQGGDGVPPILTRYLPSKFILFSLYFSSLFEIIITHACFNGLA